MKRLNVFALFITTTLAALAASQAAAQNLLANPGFEDPIVPNAPNGVGLWSAFDGGGGPTSANSAVSPRTGAQHLALGITGQNNNFAGVFQDVTGVAPGQLFNFSVWHKSVGVFDIGAELRVEWRNPANSAEVSRTGNFVPTLTPDYVQFGIPQQVVPAGVGVARVVYAIQSFGSGGTDNGTAFVDDAVATKTPEPGTLSLAVLSLLSLAGVRRRSV